MAQKLHHTTMNMDCYSSKKSVVLLLSLVFYGFAYICRIFKNRPSTFC